MDESVKLGAAYNPKVNPFKDMLARGVFVTPELADQWLSKNTNNRRLRPHSVELLAGGIEDGEWRPSPEGIYFDTKGVLGNGQHRLHAIVTAGIGIWLWVTTNVPDEAFEAVDTGRPRTTTDHINTMGDRDCVDLYTATARSILNGLQSDRSHTPIKTRRTYFKHKDAIIFAAKHLTGAERGVTSGAVCSVIAKAFYTQSQERLADFCLGLSELKPLPDNGGYAMVARLRKYLVGITSSGREGRCAKYAATTYVLDNFLRGDFNKGVRHATKEKFCLPGEKISPNELE